MCKAVLLSQTEWWPKWDLSNSNFPPFCLFWIAVSQCKHWKNCFWPIRICFDLKSGGKFKKDKWFLGHPSIWFIISALELLALLILARSRHHFIKNGCWASSIYFAEFVELQLNLVYCVDLVTRNMTQFLKVEPFEMSKIPKRFCYFS